MNIHIPLREAVALLRRVKPTANMPRRSSGRPRSLKTSDANLVLALPDGDGKRPGVSLHWPRTGIPQPEARAEVELLVELPRC